MFNGGCTSSEVVRNERLSYLNVRKKYNARTLVEVEKIEDRRYLDPKSEMKFVVNGPS